MSQSDHTADDLRSTLSLDLSVENTKAELALPEPDPTDELRERAREYADQLVSFDPADQSSRDTNRAAVEVMGRDLQRRAATRSRMLQAPVKDLSRGTEDGGPIATSLTDLRIEVEKLDPADVDLSPGHRFDYQLPRERPG